MKKRRPDDLPEDELGQIRDDDGLIVDEYTAEAFDDPDAIDALDLPRGLASDARLDNIEDAGDGIEEVSLADVRADDIAEMGLGAEPHSPEDLERAAIGRELRGRKGVTRDDEVHGERLLDRPER